MEIKKILQDYTKFLKQNNYLEKAPKNNILGYVGEYLNEWKAL